jgi:hypothetical protein
MTCLGPTLQDWTKIGSGEPPRAPKLLGVRASTISLSTMSIKAPLSDLPIYSFSSANEFEAFLNREHTTASEFHLKIAKKSSGIHQCLLPKPLKLRCYFG